MRRSSRQAITISSIAITISLFTLVVEVIAQENDRPGDGSCMKEVFHVFCLGGASENLPTGEIERTPLYVTYESPGEVTVVEIWENRVMEIFRIYRPGNRYLFTELLAELEELYGKPPGISSSAFEEIKSLERDPTGLTWEQEGWSVSIGWSPEGAEGIIQIKYRHEELFKRATTNPYGL